MVLYVLKWNVRTEIEGAYLEFTQSAIPRTLAVPGVVEMRGYRPASGDSQVVVTYEFADMTAWVTWHGHDDIQQVITELRTVTNDMTLELWGPSPIIPQPIRPGG